MRIGVRVECTICRRQKAPHGRSAPIGLSLCERGCPGYDVEPKPGCLWPGETEAEFGYPICHNATQEEEAR